jgi:hypothetical protein
MNYVYRIIFNKRKSQGIMPYLYIGSKSNAIYENGVILTNRGIPYYGSSSYKSYSEIVAEDDITVEIIKEFDIYTDALNFESMLQKSLDVVADPRYFNLCIATINNYTDPNYATYKHVETGKIVRLPRNHPMVISEQYVGVSRGIKLSDDDRKKRGRTGELNPFYGKHHTDEVKQIISEANSGRKISDDRRLWFIENVANQKKSPEHRAKIGRKGLIMLKNKDTGEVIRIPREDKETYDDTIWTNPYKLSKNKSTGSRWATNGIENKKIRAGEEIPDGFRFGRTTSWHNSKGK